MTDTIFAVSSGSPPAAIAVLRISGPAAFAAASAFVGSLPASRQASVRAVRDPVTGDLLDRAIVLVFPGPRSATGENIVELHLHGGRAVVRAVETALAAQPSLRRAEPGEFTRRALMAGRIDLTEAEGLADLLAAETETQRRAAIGTAEGAVARAVADWSARTLELAAAIEAVIDHEDEDDVGDADRIVADVRAGAAALADEIAEVVARPGVERLRDGVRVVLAGPPNSGKSTLFNAMVERDAAIVSPIAGTTRDRIEAPVVRGGIAWLITDTAGLAGETTDVVEQIGIERSHEAIAKADVVLWLGDDPPPPPVQAAVIAVHARADAPGREVVPPGRIAASGKRSAGTENIWAAITTLAGTLLPKEDQLVLNARHRELCRSAADNLADATRIAEPLFIAEELRATRLSLDHVTGRAGVEDMLDALFGRFCIGK